MQTENIFLILVIILSVLWIVWDYRKNGAFNRSDIIAILGIVLGVAALFWNGSGPEPEPTSTPIPEPESAPTLTLTSPPTPVLTTYEITLTTGCQDKAGTNARVFITVRGSKGEIQENLLDLPNHNDRERCDVDSHRVSTNDDLGDLYEVRIRHDNTGDNPGWFLEQIEIENLVTAEKWGFPCQQWLATSTGDKQISRIIPLGGPCQ